MYRIPENMFFYFKKYFISVSFKLQISDITLTKIRVKITFIFFFYGDTKNISFIILKNALIRFPITFTHGLVR